MQGYYSKEITVPRTKREGLENFLQIIINKIEAGQSHEGLLAAVDLLQDVQSGIYNGAMDDAQGRSQLGKEIEAKHQADIIATGQREYARGVAAEKARMAQALKLHAEAV